MYVAELRGLLKSFTLVAQREDAGGAGESGALSGTGAALWEVDVAGMAMWEWRLWLPLILFKSNAGFGLSKSDAWDAWCRFAAL
jgi:hypothetical protein